MNRRIRLPVSIGALTVVIFLWGAMPLKRKRNKKRCPK